MHTPFTIRLEMSKRTQSAIKNTLMAGLALAAATAYSQGTSLKGITTHELALKALTHRDLALRATAAAATTTATTATTAAAPVSHMVHGLVFNGKNQAIEVTPELILQTQARYIQQLRGDVQAPRTTSVSSQISHVQAKSQLTQADQVWANALLIASLLDKAPASVDATTLRANNLRVLSKYATAVGKPLPVDALAKGQVPDWVHADLRHLNIDIANLLFPKPPFPRYSYSRQCAAAGVPVPPTWGDPRWIEQPTPVSFSLLVPLSDHPNRLIKTYTYTPTSGPMGLCIAQPIVNDKVAAPNTFNALGIICQGISTGPNNAVSNSKACFWDNATDLVKGMSYPINSAAFNAPPHLPNDNQCTDCHAGENAFITHVGTSLQTAKDNFNDAMANATPPKDNFTSRNNWYTPLVQSNWPQNPELTPYATAPGTGCASCHHAAYAGRLPHIMGSVTPRDNLFKYCSFLLPGELNSGATADSAGPMFGYRADPDAAAPLQAMHDGCSLLFSPYFPSSVSAWLP